MRGASSRGALLSVLFLVTGVYFGLNAAVPYWRYVRFRDEMRQQALVAHCVPDDAIERRLRAKAEELGLPPEASVIHVERKPRERITIWATYEVLVELPGLVRTWRFTPRVEERL